MGRGTALGAGDSARVRAAFGRSERWQLGGLLGGGGMGLVYVARHPVSGSPVEIKVLRPRLMDQPSLVKRFIQERDCLGALSSDHVVRILDSGQLDGLPFLVMERLNGMSVSGLIAACRRFSTTVAVDYALQVCAGLAEVHARGLVHLDIKPSNLFVALRGEAPPRLTILDFGIARWLDSRSVGDETSHDTIIGSPLYSSPEQIDDPTATDARSDIWSLGVVLFEMLSGKTPFAGRSASEIYGRVLACSPRRLRELRPGVDRRLAAVVEGCLMRDRERRFSSIPSLVSALAPFGSRAATERSLPCWSRSRPTHRLDGNAARSMVHVRPGPLTVQR